MDVNDVPVGIVPFKIWSNKDEEIFAKDKVLYEGHPIGAILACNEAVARKAAALVKVQYEVLKPVVSIDDAIQANSYIEVSFSVILSLRKPGQVDEKSTCTSFDVGDVDGALAKSEKVVKGRIDTPRQEHFYEETSLAIVVPVGEDEEYKIYYPTPAILFAQQMVSGPYKRRTRRLIQILQGLNVSWSPVQQSDSYIKKGENDLKESKLMKDVLR